jgi:hypothetical protein
MEPIIVVVILGGLAAWVGWGWRGWLRSRPGNLSLGMKCSLVGFAFASLSASLEIGWGLNARFADDVKLLSDSFLVIYGVGFLSALLGLVCGLCGVASKTPLRWKSPALATVLLLLWLAQTIVAFIEGSQGKG